MATDDNEYPVLTQFNGKVDYVRIGEVRKNTYYGRSAFLAEPFGSRMGAFNYDDLLNNGRAESAGYTVYLPDFWEANQESELEKYSKKRFTTFPSNRPVGPKEAEHAESGAARRRFSLRASVVAGAAGTVIGWGRVARARVVAAMGPNQLS